MSMLLWQFLAFYALICVFIVQGEHNMYFDDMNYNIRPRRGRIHDIPCPEPGSIENGRKFLKRKLIRIECNKGYTLFGQRYILCDSDSGKWLADKPICAKRGCGKYVNTTNGLISSNGLDATIICLDGYTWVGNRITYCNGTTWDRTLGYCRLQNRTHLHECDFETEDLCGWVTYTSKSYQWKRKMAANLFLSQGTGPQHDHTTKSAENGHYMLLESYHRENYYAPLISPIYSQELSLKTACCFRFYYYMYGSGVGDLYVYIKPFSKPIEELIDNNDTEYKYFGNNENL